MEYAYDRLRQSLEGCTFRHSETGEILEIPTSSSDQGLGLIYIELKGPSTRIPLRPNDLKNLELIQPNPQLKTSPQC